MSRSDKSGRACFPWLRNKGHQSFQRDVSSRRGNDVPVHVGVLLCHGTSCKMMLDMGAYSCSVKLVNPGKTVHHLIHISNQKATRSMSDNFWCRATIKCNDGTSCGHALDHHHAKGLFPLDRIERRTRTTQPLHLLLPANRTNVGDLVLIDAWFDDLFKVVD